MSLRTSLHRSMRTATVRRAPCLPRSMTTKVDNSLKTPETQALQKLRLITAIKTPYKPDGGVSQICPADLSGGG